MPRVPNYWIDPKGVVPDPYPWPVNHSEEQPVGKSRQMADGAPTANIGLIPQQGAATPLIFNLKGKIFDESQHNVNLFFWELCETQSIYWQDFQAYKYEVLISDYQVNRIGVAANPKFPNLTWVFDYTMVLRVLHVFNGPWAEVAP